jgi:phosphatidate cytidylyltransferase
VKQRVASATVLLPIAVALVVLGGTPYFLGIALMCLAALWEITALLGVMSPATISRDWRYFTMIAGACLLFCAFFARYHAQAPQLGVAAVLIASLAGLLLGGQPAHRTMQWVVGTAAVVYVIGFGVHFILLRETSRGLGWTLLACAATWSTDIGAFFAGRQYGKRPFFQAISPKKTLEGAIGGLAAGTVAALLVCLIAGLHVPVLVALLIGLTASAAGQAGDLVESLIKREAGVKDSGTLIPGHGGVMDRIDSLLFVITVVYYWRQLFI